MPLASLVSAYAEFLAPFTDGLSGNASQDGGATKGGDFFSRHGLICAPGSAILSTGVEMKKSPISGIYAIINYAEKRSYVGSSVDIKTRIVGHRSRLRRGKHHSKELQSDWDRLGESQFSFLFLEEADLTKLRDREIFWIKSLRGMDRYNTATPCNRRDERFYKLDHCNTSVGVVHVGQPVWMRGQIWEIDEIHRYRCINNAVLSNGRFKTTVYGLHYGVSFTPMECE